MKSVSPTRETRSFLKQNRRRETTRNETLGLGVTSLYSYIICIPDWTRWGCDDKRAVKLTSAPSRRLAVPRPPAISSHIATLASELCMNLITMRHTWRRELGRRLPARQLMDKSAASSYHASIWSGIHPGVGMPSPLATRRPVYPYPGLAPLQRPSTSDGTRALIRKHVPCESALCPYRYNPTCLPSQSQVLSFLPHNCCLEQDVDKDRIRGYRSRGSATTRGQRATRMISVAAQVRCCLQGFQPWNPGRLSNDAPAWP